MSEIPPKNKVTPKQRLAIESLITQGTPVRAALDAGIDRKTLYLWLRDPDFGTALRLAEREAQDAFNRQLFGLRDDAIAALRDGLHTRQKINVRLRAAALYLDAYLKFGDMADLEGRLAEMESNYANQST